MNRENVLKLREAVEHDFLVERGIGLNMGAVFGKTNGLKDVTGKGCGTVACLAGYSAILCGIVKPDEDGILDYGAGLSTVEFAEVSDWLGICTHALFHPPGWSDPSYASATYTKPVVLAALDILLEEGEEVPMYDLWDKARERVTAEGRVQA